jgi:hypothetical protein
LSVSVSEEPNPKEWSAFNENTKAGEKGEKREQANPRDQQNHMILGQPITVLRIILLPGSFLLSIPNG